MHVCIPYSLIKRASKEGFVDTLIYWLWIKRQGGKVYNYSSEQAARMLYISTSSACYHVNKMIKLGLARKEGKILMTTAPKKLLQNSYEPLVKVKTCRNKRQQKDFILFHLIRSSLLQQKTAIREKAQIIKSQKDKKKVGISPKQRYYLKEFGNERAVGRSFQNRTTLSNEKSGELINRSKITARKYLRRMSKVGLLKISPHIEFYAQVSESGFNLLRESIINLRYDKTLGCAFIQKSNTIELTTMAFSRGKKTA